MYGNGLCVCVYANQFSCKPHLIWIAIFGKNDSIGVSQSWLLATVYNLLFAGAGADPLATTDTGWTALHSAARWDCAPAVELLLHYIPVNSITQGGNTPLHLACQHNHRHTVELLLAQQGIKVDMKNSQGDTPRMVAERMGNLGQLFDAVMPRGVISHKE